MGAVMQSYPFDALDRIGLQLSLLNLQLCVYLCCKGMNYAARVMFGAVTVAYDP